jgi:hypothetical protein
MHPVRTAPMHVRPVDTWRCPDCSRRHAARRSHPTNSDPTAPSVRKRIGCGARVYICGHSAMPSLSPQGAGEVDLCTECRASIGRTLQSTSVEPCAPRCRPSCPLLRSMFVKLELSASGEGAWPHATSPRLITAFVAPMQLVRSRSPARVCCPYFGETPFSAIRPRRTCGGCPFRSHGRRSKPRCTS